MVLGEGKVTATMEGSQAAPSIRAQWQAQGAEAHGTATLKPETTDLTIHAPCLDVQGRLYMQPPDLEALKQATTQAEVSALARQVRVALIALCWLPALTMTFRAVSQQQLCHV